MVKELAELEVHLLGERDDERFADGMLEPPPALPDCAPLGSPFPAFVRAAAHADNSHDA